MPRSIVVPLDGSEFSEAALPFAVAMARRRGAAIQLVSVYSPLVQTLDLPDAPTYDRTMDDELKAELGRTVEQVAERLARESGAAVTTVLLEEQGVAAALAAYAAGCGAELIVMTTHGRGGFDRAWLGSVADELVRRSAVPVLLVRPGPGDAPRHSGDGFAHALVPLDGSPLAEEILEPALRIGARQYTLLRVVPTPPTRLPPEETYWTPREEAQMAEAKAAAHGYLESIAARVRTAERAVTTVVILDPDPARAIIRCSAGRGIIRCSAERGVDLVAISTHARSGVARMLVGSVADKIVRGSTIPTLLARPRGRAQSG
jgi:nucleotide-binding universal stress UspA family protein